MSIDRPNHAGVHIGDTIEITNDFITIKLIDTLNQGDGVKFDSTDKGFICNKIYFKGKLVSHGEAGQTIQLENKINLKGNDRLMLTKDIALVSSLENYAEKKIPITLAGEFFADKASRLTIEDGIANVVSREGAVVQASINAPISQEDIILNLSKLGDTAYTAETVTVKKDESIFISKSNINQLRRDAVSALNDKRTAVKQYFKKEFTVNYSADEPMPPYICCTVNNEEQLAAAIKRPNTRIYIRDFSLYAKYKSSADVYYFMPGIAGNTEDYQNEKLVIRDTGGIKYTANNSVVCDYMLNASNSLSLQHMHSNGAKSVCLSAEINDDNIKDTCSNYKKSYGNYPNCEVLVYGRVQLMALKHCILEGSVKCGTCKTENYASPLTGLMKYRF